MKRSPLTSFLIGLWLGGSVILIGVVAYSFPGIELALDANEKLAQKAGFDPSNDDAKKTSALWVYTGEQNRAYFWGWNRVQLGLGTLALLSALVFLRRKSVLLCLALAVGITAGLTFWLAPEITSRGRELDFVARTPPPEGLEDFDRFHKLYTGLEGGKIVLVLAAGLLALRRSGT